MLDPKIWTLSQTIANIGLYFGISNLKSRNADKAVDYLFLAQHHIEPLPNSDWQSLKEWQMLKRDVCKNVALFHQQKDDLPKALDSLRQAIHFEKQLGDNSANTCLTSAVFL